MLKQHRVKILKAIARILFSYAYSIEKAVSRESKPEEQPDKSSSNDAPPAHWLAKVRQGAPHLLEQNSFEHPTTQSTPFNQESVVDANDAITVKNEKEIVSGPENLGRKKQQFNSQNLIHRLVHAKQPELPSDSNDNKINKTLQLHSKANTSPGSVFFRKNRSEHKAFKNPRINPDNQRDKQSSSHRFQQPDKIDTQKTASIKNSYTAIETIKQPPIQFKPISKPVTANDRFGQTKITPPEAAKETKQTIIKLSPKQPFFRSAKKHQNSVKKVEVEHAVEKNKKTVPILEATKNKAHSFSRATLDETINLNLKAQKITQPVQTNNKKNKAISWQQEDSDKQKIEIINHWPELPEDEWLKSSNNRDQSLNHWQLQSEIKNQTMSEQEQRGRLWNV